MWVVGGMSQRAVGEGCFGLEASESVHPRDGDREAWADSAERGSKDNYSYNDVKYKKDHFLFLDHNCLLSLFSSFGHCYRHHHSLILR